MDTDAPASLCGIYAIRHITTDKFYVGQVGGTSGRGFLKRCQEHCYNALESKCHHSYSNFGRAVRKYGNEQFEFIVLEVIDKGLGNDVFDSAELRWMIHFNSFIPHGYNVQHGSTPRGVKRSDETRRKMSEARKKMLAENPVVAEKLRTRVSERNRSEKSREAFLDISSSSEFNEKRLSALKLHFSDVEKRNETSRKRIESRERNGNLRRVVCVETGNEFRSISEAARSIGVAPGTLGGHLRGRSSTCRGLKFKFAEDSE